MRYYKVNKRIYFFGPNIHAKAAAQHFPPHALPPRAGPQWPGGAVTIGWTQQHVMSSHCRPSLSFRFYPRRRRRAAASSPSLGDSSRSRPSRPPQVRLPTPLRAQSLPPRVRLPLDGMGIASQHPRGVDFRLGFSPHFAAPGFRLHACGRVHPHAVVRPFGMDGDWDEGPVWVAESRLPVLGRRFWREERLRRLGEHDFGSLCPS